MENRKPHTPIFIFGATVTVFVSCLALPRVWAQSDSKDVASKWQAPTRAAHRKNPDPQSLAFGKTVYNRECLSCHGATGKGDGPVFKNLERAPADLSDPKVQQQTDGALDWKISTGHRPMPTFKLHLSEDERWHVINYIRTFSAEPVKDKQQS